MEVAWSGLVQRDEYCLAPPPLPPPPQQQGRAEQKGTLPPTILLQASYSDVGRLLAAGACAGVVVVLIRSPHMMNLTN